MMPAAGSPVGKVTKRSSPFAEARFSMREFPAVSVSSKSSFAAMSLFAASVPVQRTA